MCNCNRMHKYNVLKLIHWCHTVNDSVTQAADETTDEILIYDPFNPVLPYLH